MAILHFVNTKNEHNNGLTKTSIGYTAQTLRNALQHHNFDSYNEDLQYPYIDHSTKITNTHKQKHNCKRHGVARPAY